MKPQVKIAEDAARKAGRIITRSLDKLDSIKITEKSRNDYVTEVDQLAEQEIVKHILTAYPNHHVLGEEGGNQGPESDNVWLIDPLDGTTNFIHGLPHFSISIAMTHKGRLEHGLIYDPVRDEMFTASRGHGAFLNGRRIRVSQQKSLALSLVGTGFPFKHVQHIKPYLKTFENLFPETGGVRRGGSAALDLAYIASGRLDGFWEISLNKWDMAAGVLLVKEAGGLVSDFRGGEAYMESGNIVAGNPKILKSMLKIILPSLEQV